MAKDGKDYASLYNDPEYWNGNIGYRTPGYSDFTINTIKDFCILLSGAKSVIDVGCAAGYTVTRLNEVGVPSKGIDISSYIISKAPEVCRQFLTVAPAWSIPFPNKHFDFLFSSGMLEHIPKDYLRRTCNEMMRVSTRGLIGVACLDDETTHEGDDDTHEILLTLSQWQEYFDCNYILVSDSESSWRRLATLMLLRGLKKSA